MPYSSKNSGQNPLTGRRMKTTTAKTIGGRNKSNTNVAKMRPTRSSATGRIPMRRIETDLGSGKLGGGELGGGGMKPGR
jgi:hypothetical protein